MVTQRLRQQVEFLIEVDKLKQVLRQSLVIDGSRRENDAEHSWHLAMMVLVLIEHSNEPVDAFRVMKMVLIHDLVEIDAGDVFLYDEAANLKKAEKEQDAANRIFNLLPTDLASELRVLWDEFELQKTPDSQFATALDRLQPLLLNCRNRSGPWKTHGITRDQVIARNEKIAKGSAVLWEHALEEIEQAVNQGILR